MKIRFTGIYELDEFFQALWEERQKLRDLGVKYVRSPTLYYTPVDEHGDNVVFHHPTGEPMEGWKNRGPYRSAAREFDL